jgi:glycosyltransferase involved in cell wall biosynthesis
LNQKNKQLDIPRPLFSIGVPTYNRKYLLKQTLLSILEQTFTDFEVIVGNDFPEESLSLDMLGIKDSRVRIINYKRNIGELENMNFLLNTAQGRYFTWLFDDDPCAQSLLSEVYSALTKFNFPQCVFTAFTFIYGTSSYKFKKNYNGQLQVFSGRDFLRKYLSGSLKALGCCGLYNIDYLKSIGGAKRLTNGFMALHSEYLLLLGAGMLPRVAYINSPLVSSRIHKNSWTCSNSDAELFRQAGIALIRESIVLFSSDGLKDDFNENLLSILKSVISATVVKIIICNKRLDVQDIMRYRSLIVEEFNSLKGSAFHEIAMSALDEALKNVSRYVFKARIKMIMPLGCLKFTHRLLSIISRYHKPF